MTARTSKKAIKAKAKVYKDRNVNEVLKNQNSWRSVQYTLNVSKSQKEIVVYSISPKNKPFFLIYPKGKIRGILSW